MIKPFPLFGIPRLEKVPDDRPKSFVGDGIALFEEANRAWLYLRFDLDGDDLEVEIVGDQPPPGSSIGYEIDEGGFDFIFDTAGAGRALRWMLRNGIAPGQCAWINFESQFSHDTWTGEYDVHHSYDIMEIEPWPAERILAAWDDYFGSDILKIGA
jgi:hypothetical protein